MKFEIILSNIEITQITIQRILSLFCEYECKKDMCKCTIAHLFMIRLIDIPVIILELNVTLMNGFRFKLHTLKL